MQTGKKNPKWIPVLVVTSTTSIVLIQSWHLPQVRSSIFWGLLQQFIFHISPPVTINSDSSKYLLPRLMRHHWALIRWLQSQMLLSLSTATLLGPWALCWDLDRTGRFLRTYNSRHKGYEIWYPTVIVRRGALDILVILDNTGSGRRSTEDMLTHILQDRTFLSSTMTVWAELLLNWSSVHHHNHCKAWVTF